MSDFLAQMTRASRQRVAERASASAPLSPPVNASPTLPAAPSPLRPSDFLLIAEFKRISPAAGPLGSTADPHAALAAQIDAYARGGASAISVLTEPSRFGGSLHDLRSAVSLAGPSALPVMRKDFLVDCAQIDEARECGADGVLLIARILSDSELHEMTALAVRLGMFVLIEAFDAAELDRAARIHDHLAPAPPALSMPPVVLGLNCRNLATLAIDVAVFDRLAPAVRSLGRRDIKVIAESGLTSPGDVARVADLGYAGALVGSSLMRAADPASACAQILSAVRSTNHRSRTEARS